MVAATNQLHNSQVLHMLKQKKQIIDVNCNKKVRSAAWQFQY